MNTSKRALSLALLFLSSLHLSAQPGSLDYSFNPTDVGFRNGLGFSSGTFDEVTVIKRQSDGRAIIGGAFSRYNGTQLGNIVRLTPDGLVDGTFQTGSGFSGTVRTIELDPAGGCFVGGGSSQYNGVAIGLLVRLNDNGSLDATYPAGAGPNGEVRTMLMQPDGKLIIGGTFTSVNGTPRARIARLLADGSLDIAFDPGSGANGSVDALALQSDGSILIGGAFTDVNGTPLNKIARLTSAGAVDATFLIGTGANAGVLGLAIQSDGNILLNGDFTSINGVSRSRIARLNASGGLDATFFPTGTSGGNILTMKLLQSGKVLIGGSFLSVGGTSRNRIARLENNGSVDATFDPGMGVGGWVRAMDELPDGRILVGGQFTTYAGVWRSRLTRITGAGALDLTFNPGSGSIGGVGVMVPQPDGRVLIGGTFTLYNGEVRFRVARINADGSLDSSFDPGIGPSTEGDIVSALAVQSDGKVLVGGTFLNWSGVSNRRLVRLMPDGTLDPTFTTGTGPNSQVQSFALRPDGRILIGGLFTAYDGVNSSRIASLNADGSLDPTFDPGTGFNGSVTDVILLPDGKILVSGFFTDYNGTTVGRLARLNADGSLDATFNSGTAANNTILDMDVWPDGRILISGYFTSYAGTARSKLARLLPDGTIDPSFTVGTGLSNVTDVLSIPGGGAYLVGGFTSYNGTSVNSVARLFSDGTIDASFNENGSGTGTTTTPLSLLLQADDRLLIGGNFVSYDGVGRNYIARLHTLPVILVQLQVMLGGPYDMVSGSMYDALGGQGLLPMLEGYSASGLALSGYGGESVQAQMLGELPGGNNAVDWIQISLSTVEAPGAPVALRNVLIRQDGHLMDLDGSDNIAINGISPGNYYVSVLHRNHLGTSTATPVALSPLPLSVDFTDPATSTWGADDRYNINGIMVLWPGDANNDGTVIYTGSNNDRDLILTAIGGTTPTNTVNNTYSPLDINMDGAIRYTGTNNDRDIILQTIGGVVPTATRVQQLP